MSNGCIWRASIMGSVIGGLVGGGSGNLFFGLAAFFFSYFVLLFLGGIEENTRKKELK